MRLILHSRSAFLISKAAQEADGRRVPSNAYVFSKPKRSAGCSCGRKANHARFAHSRHVLTIGYGFAALVSRVADYGS